MSPDLLIAGAFIGSILTFVAIAIRRYTRHLLAVGLVIAALIYAGFAIEARAGVTWLAIELAGVAIYGTLALRGFRRSAWWLAAGWALHPVWDIALHYAGAGHAFAPEWWAVSCFTWDLATAAIIAIAIIIGTHLSPAPLAPVEGVVIPSEGPQARSRGIATLLVEGPLCRDDRDSSTARALCARSARNDECPRALCARSARSDECPRGRCARSARNDIFCHCRSCTATEAHAA
jgi:hypothetical protein